MNDRSFADFVGSLPPDAEALFAPTVTRSSAELDQIPQVLASATSAWCGTSVRGCRRASWGGPSTLTETIAAALGERVQLGAAVQEIVQKNSVVVRYRRTTSTGRSSAPCRAGHPGPDQSPAGSRSGRRRPGGPRQDRVRPVCQRGIPDERDRAGRGTTPMRSRLRSARSMLRSTCRISCTATPPSGNRAAASSDVRRGIWPANSWSSTTMRFWRPTSRIWRRCCPDSAGPWSNPRSTGGRSARRTASRAARACSGPDPQCRTGDAGRRLPRHEYTETAVHTGLKAAQEVQSLLATDRQHANPLTAVRRPADQGGPPGPPSPFLPTLPER